MTAEVRANSGTDRRLEAEAPVAAEPDAGGELESSPCEATEAAASAEPAEACCGTCRFYLARKFHQAAEPLGTCRAHPFQPVVQASAWCGEHEERL